MSGKITQDIFGQTKDGKDVSRFTLSNSNHSLVVRIIEYGGIITEINIPDRNGKMTDINLGMSNMTDYEPDNPYLGALIGRVSNRIADGQFTLDGETYHLNVNNGPHTNHGGIMGFDKKLWSGEVKGNKLELTYVSPDKDENFPGELTTTVTFSVTDDNELCIQYKAVTTKATPINLTCHAFFNLAGHAAGNLDHHNVTVYADHFLPVDETSVPTGEIRKVDGTLMDLRKPVPLRECLEQLPERKGFDTTFCLPVSDGQLQLAAKVEHSLFGRFIECWTTQPSLHLYTAFYLDIPHGKEGAVYKQFGAFCLEAQHYPDSVHKPSFPCTILRPGETFNQTTVYKFGIS